jgi:DNA-binding transcriptional LysR family regulator
MADEVAELQLFVEIVKAGNLSAAARALNSSPAAMSRGLTALESRLGVRLVTRTSRTFELTAEGHQFYERCERIVAEIAEAEAEASSQGKTVKGKLRIGAPMGIGRRLVALWSLASLRSTLAFRFISTYRIPAWMLSMMGLMSPCATACRRIRV